MSESSFKLVSTYDPALELPAETAWKTAILSGLKMQALMGLLFALLLDGGRMLHIYAAAWFGQLFAALLVVLRGERSPTTLDLAFVRFGILLSLLIALLLCKVLRPDY